MTSSSNVFHILDIVLPIFERSAKMRSSANALHAWSGRVQIPVNPENSWSEQRNTGDGRDGSQRGREKMEYPGV